MQILRKPFRFRRSLESHAEAGMIRSTRAIQTVRGCMTMSKVSLQTKVEYGDAPWTFGTWLDGRSIAASSTQKDGNIGKSG